MNQIVRRALIVFCLCGSILSFQNCRQVDSTAVTTNKIEESPSAFQRIPASNVNNLKMFSVVQGRYGYYSLDMVSGQINMLDEDAESPIDPQRRFCLSDQELQSIRSILESSDICQPEQQADAEINCPMIYRYPYAIANLSGLEIRLGEKKNGCDKAADLCDGKERLLQDKIYEVLTNLKECR